MYPRRKHPMRTHSARTSIPDKTAQVENMIGMKSPRFPVAHRYTKYNIKGSTLLISSTTHIFNLKIFQKTTHDMNSFYLYFLIQRTLFHKN